MPPVPTCYTFPTHEAHYIKKSLICIPFYSNKQQPWTEGSHLNQVPQHVYGRTKQRARKGQSTKKVTEKILFTDTESRECNLIEYYA